MENKVTTSDRLKFIMNAKNLRQVDILKLCEPYSKKYNIPLKKNHLSQYISGTNLPRKDKLTVLANALNVNEVWLMGYNVPMQKEILLNNNDNNEPINYQITLKYGEYSNDVLKVFSKLDNIDKLRILERIEVLLEDYKYK